MYRQSPLHSLSDLLYGSTMEEVESIDEALSLSGRIAFHSSGSWQVLLATLPLAGLYLLKSGKNLSIAIASKAHSLISRCLTNIDFLKRFHICVYSPAHDRDLKKAKNRRRDITAKTSQKTSFSSMRANKGDIVNLSCPFS